MLNGPRKAFFRGLLALAVVLLLVGAAGCGGSSDSSSSSTSSTASSEDAESTPAPEAQGGPSAAEAAKLGEEASTREGPAVKLPVETIGVLDVASGSEATRRGEEAAAQAAEALGWKTVLIDAEGSPQKMTAGMSTLINEGVDAILDVANPTAVISKQLEEAKSKGIPVINVVGTQEPNPGIVAYYADNPVDMAEALANYMLENISEGETVGSNTEQLYEETNTRDEKVKEILEGAGIKVEETPVEPEAVPESTTRNTRAAITKNPGIAGFVGSDDRSFSAVGQVLSSLNKCGEIQNYGFYDDLLNLKTIREGCGTAVVTSPPEADSYAAMDQLAQYFAREKQLSEIPERWKELEAQVYHVPIRGAEAQEIITESNLPPEGQYVKPKLDFISFFDAKWQKEFGVPKG
jgi:ABC-type sugar transport system substrate-binding protein